MDPSHDEEEDGNEDEIVANSPPTSDESGIWKLGFWVPETQPGNLLNGICTWIFFIFSTQIDDF